MIANVEIQGYCLKVYDKHQQIVGEMPSIEVTIVGFGPEFFITREGPWVVTYDRGCNKIGQMLKKQVIIRSISRDTFNAVEGKWVRMYDRQCGLLREKKVR